MPTAHHPNRRGEGDGTGRCVSNSARTRAQPQASFLPSKAAKFGFFLGQGLPSLLLVSIIWCSPCMQEEVLFELLDRAARSRAIASTKFNQQSSRSHCIFTLNIIGTSEHKVCALLLYPCCARVGRLLGLGTRLPPPPLPALRAHLVTKGQ